MVCDDGIPQVCDEATVTIVVTPTPPMAVNNFSVTNLNTPISLDVVTNDLAFASGDVLQLSGVPTPSAGSLTVS